MGLETGTTIADLNENWPEGTDNVSQGDDHLRLIKSVLKSQFPNLDCPVTATCDDLNKTIDLTTGTKYGQTSMAGSQSLPAAKTVLNWDTVDFDSDTQFSGSTFTCKQDGLYHCIATPQISDPDQALQSEVFADVTSTDFPQSLRLFRFRCSTGSTAVNQLSGNGHLRLRSGDTVVISHTGLRTTTFGGGFWSMARIGDIPAAAP